MLAYFGWRELGSGAVWSSVSLARPRIRTGRRGQHAAAGRLRRIDVRVTGRGRDVGEMEERWGVGCEPTRVEIPRYTALGRWRGWGQSQWSAPERACGRRMARAVFRAARVVVAGVAGLAHARSAAAAGTPAVTHRRVVCPCNLRLPAGAMPVVPSRELLGLQGVLCRQDELEHERDR